MFRAIVCLSKNCNAKVSSIANFSATNRLSFKLSNLQSTITTEGKINKSKDCVVYWFTSYSRKNSKTETLYFVEQTRALGIICERAAFNKSFKFKWKSLQFCSLGHHAIVESGYFHFWKAVSAEMVRVQVTIFFV